MTFTATRHGWPTAPTHHYDATPTAVVAHPDDPGVLLGAIGAVRPGVADAVVSLCRMGRDDVPLAGVAPEDHVEFWLVDEVGANLDPGAVLRDAAATVAALRAEGKTVLLHCLAMHSRTPLVAAVYGARITGDSVRASLDRVEAALPITFLNRELLEEALA